jgi:hypothetical protein
MDIDYLFYLGVLLITHLLTPGGNLFMRLITADSLLCTYRFFRTYVNKNLTESQIVSKTKSLYIRSIFDRYIFYLLCYLVYKLICGFFWVTDLNCLYYIITLVSIPPLLNKLLLGEIYADIKRRKEHIIKLLAAKMFATAIRFLSKTYLNRDDKVKSREVFPLLDNYDNTTGYLIEVGKNVGIMLALTYIKSYSPNFYYRIVTYYYNRRSGNILMSYNELSAKRMLNNIIDQKKWEELLKPNVYKAMFSLYHIESDDMDIFKNLATNLNFMIFKFGTIWTVATYVGHIYTVPFLSIFFITYRKGKSVLQCAEDYYRIGMIILGFILGYVTDSIVIATIVSQLGYMIIVNKLTMTLGKYLSKKIWKHVKFIYARNLNYLSPVLGAGMHIGFFAYLFDINSWLFIILQLCYFLMISYDMSRAIVFCILLMSTSLSYFNPLHILYNIILIYIGLGKMDFSMFEGLVGQARYWYSQDWNIFRFPDYHEQDELIKDFEYMDTDKFPSISNAPPVNFLVRRGCEDLDDLNRQKIEHTVNNSEIFEGIDDKIFNLPKNRFIDAIGINDDDDDDDGGGGNVKLQEDVNNEEIIEETELESKDGSRYTVKKSNGNNSLAIFNNFC